MIRTILIPLDGSAIAEQAIPVGRDLARSLGAAIRLVTVHDFRLAQLAGLEQHDAVAAIDAETREDERAHLSRTSEGLRAEGLEVDVALREGDPAAALLRDARDHDVGLIMMTTHGRGGLSRLWLGSVADRLVRQADVPVLLLPADAPALTLQMLLEKVLVPLDGSVRAEAALAIERAIAGPTPGTVHLLHVVSPPAVLGPPSALSYEAESVRTRTLHAYRYLRRIARRVRDAGSEIAAQVFVSRHPAAEILAYAAHHGIRLVALATHGRGGIARWAMGSVADKVVRAGSVAVLVCHTAQGPDDVSADYRAAMNEPDPATYALADSTPAAVS